MNKTEERMNKKGTKKLGVIILILVIILGVFGVKFSIESYYKKNVPYKIIKQDVIGTTVSVNGIKMEITKENLESVKIEEKEIEVDFGIYICTYNGIVTISDKNYDAEIPFESSYMRSRVAKDWELWNVELDNDEDNVDLSINSYITEEIIQEAFIGKTVSGLKITDSIAHNITLIDEDDDFEGTVEIEAELYDTSKNPKQRIIIEADFRFDGETWNMRRFSSEREKN